MLFEATLEMRGSVALITLSGELDAATAPHFREKVEEAAAQRARRLVLIMDDLAYMASAGLRVMIFAKQALGQGVDLYINQDCAYSSTTQCVYPLNISDYIPVTGAVQFDASKGPKIPSNQDQLIYIEVVDGSYPFQDGGLLVNS